VREVYEALREQRRVAYTTVMTMLNILESKGYLRKEPEGRAYRYHPTQPERRVMTALVRDFVDRVFDGAATPLLAHLVTDTRLSKPGRTPAGDYRGWNHDAACKRWPSTAPIADHGCRDGCGVAGPPPCASGPAVACNGALCLALPSAHRPAPAPITVTFGRVDWSSPLPRTALSRWLGPWSPPCCWPG
jgi:hypothetical protein